jgi:hypothetical protein
MFFCGIHYTLATFIFLKPAHFYSLLAVNETEPFGFFNPPRVYWLCFDNLGWYMQPSSNREAKFCAMLQNID